MKHYAYISIFLLFMLLAIAGCRSNRNLSENRQTQLSEKNIEQSNIQERIDSTTSARVDQTTVEDSASSEQAVSAAEKETKSDEYEIERTRATYYGEDGKPKLVIENERERGRTDQTNERAGSSHASDRSGTVFTKLEGETASVSQTERSGERTQISESEVNTDEQTNLNEKSDSRIVQGWEWLAIIVPIAIIVAITYLIRNGRKNNNSNSSGY